MEILNTMVIRSPRLAGGLVLGLAIGLAALRPADAGQLFTMTEQAPDVVGELHLATTVYEDTLSDLARAYDQGYYEMRLANPSVDPWLPGDGAEIIVPNLYIVPNAPRRGIVVNVAEMRLYYYPGAQGGLPQEVMTFPISIGRQNWTTPKGQMTIVAKAKDPAWYPPQSIREEHAAEGDILPRVVPAGPDNPLGRHALRLSASGYLIHGTNKPYGIGMRVTHGCIRMYPKDVETIFERAGVGTPVHVVNQPYKVGIAHGRVWLEVHPHLDEDKDVFSDQYSHVVRLLLDRVEGRDVQLVWGEIRRVITEKSGIPQAVGSLRPRAAAAGEVMAVEKKNPA